MQAPLTACFEPAGKLWQLCKVLYVFEHKMQYLLIHAPCTCIVVFWHISNIPQGFWRVKFVLIPPRFVQQQYLWNIAIQPAVGCYNSWDNLRCSGCSPLGEISFWNGTITWNPFRMSRYIKHSEALYLEFIDRFRMSWYIKYQYLIV